MCDVNGWSFVKNSRKYYDDCAQILTEMMRKNCRADAVCNPRHRSVSRTHEHKHAESFKKKVTSMDYMNAADQAEARPPSPSALSLQSTSDYEVTRDIKEDMEELRCIIAITRHGDRTPKQKMKVSVEDARYIQFYSSYSPNPKKELRIKAKTALVQFLEITKEVVGDMEGTDPASGMCKRLRQIRDVLMRWEISGINRKLQIKPTRWDECVTEGGEAVCRIQEVLLILKWGGDLTPMGRTQAENLGAEFRKNMYPDPDGGGVLRLHATYRHDLKIRASDEGRVMKTAAAFAKGLLDLEGNLTPILVSLVSGNELHNTCLRIAAIA